MPTKSDLRELELRCARQMKVLREGHGLTQVQLAEYLSIDRTQISRKEQGTQGISISEAFFMALKFNLPLEALLPDKSRDLLPNLKKFQQKQTLKLFKMLNELPPHHQDMVVSTIEHLMKQLKNIK